MKSTCRMHTKEIKKINKEHFKSINGISLKVKSLEYKLKYNKGNHELIETKIKCEIFWALKNKNEGLTCIQKGLAAL